MMDRVILHSDCNCFYASVEMLYDRRLRSVPMAVGGDPEARHGIVLTANYIAKKRGVKTGMALWQARQVCGDVVFVPPRMDLYIRFSRMVREIYSEYSDLVESFGLDECWIDATQSIGIRGSGLQIAEEISRRIKKEIGITVSIGVSWNKVYAKLGSDYRKPDAITVFSRENYRRMVYPIPVSDLLYVGRASGKKLRNFGILTIGELAEADPAMLKQSMGKMGLMLSLFAKGMDETPVSREDSSVPVKSIGNSTTTPRDLVNEEDVKLVLYLLAESVAGRLREHCFKGDVIEVYVRDSELIGLCRQHKFAPATNISEEIALQALSLFRQMYRWQRSIRSIGIRICDLRPEDDPWQIDLFHDPEKRERQKKADLVMEEIRRRYGFGMVQRGIMYEDRLLSSMNARADDHMIHPHSYLERGNRTGVERL